jgi:hypothetical protein
MVIGSAISAIGKGLKAAGKHIGKSMAENEGGSNLSRFLGAKIARMGDEKKDEETVEGSMRKGGRVKKTGLYRLHKGEEVVPPEKARKARKSGRKASRSSGRS